MKNNPVSQSILARRQFLKNTVRGAVALTLPEVFSVVRDYAVGKPLTRKASDGENICISR
jgi:hypothetical protein